jgi:polyisoprenyl-teichoic acid--peptidoglycan teichoic acid transferase
MNPFEAARFVIRPVLSAGGTHAEIHPGFPQYVGGISYWVPNVNAGRQVVEATVGSGKDDP